MGLPNELNLLIPYDIGVVVYLALFCLLVGRTSPERAAAWAVILSWFLVHVYFGLHYMRLYYDDTVVDGKTSYQTGLEFPQRVTADIWDFMCYSFTIAMCYQTSDVTVTSVRIRRVTLVHAIFSFLFVSPIIGFVVNIISNIT